MLRNWALALRPTLSLDFLAGLNDSRITYSGGTNGTQVNSAGVIVAATTPRFDYDPVTLAAKGLLVEEARTNLLTYSEQFDIAWSPFQTTVTANAITSPDGTQNADKLAETNTNTPHLISEAATVAASTTHTFSCFIKAAENTLVQISIDDGTSNGCFANLNLATGATTRAELAGTGTYVGSTVAAFSGGWYRLSVSGGIGTATTARVAVSLISSTLAGIFPSYTGTTGSGLYLWGAQLEAGSFPTSYIPTTSASVTRTADSAVMTGTNFSSWFNATEGTFVVAGDRNTAGGSTGVLFGCAETGNFNNSMYASNSSGGGSAIDILYFSGGVSQANVGRNPANILNPFKLATSYAANDFAGTVDGQAPNTDASGTVPSPMQRLAIGDAPWGPGTVLWNGHIRSIAYYPVRMSNEQLQALTS